jgi:hypothetical protein
MESVQFHGLLHHLQATAVGGCRGAPKTRPSPWSHAATRPHSHRERHHSGGPVAPRGASNPERRSEEAQL